MTSQFGRTASDLLAFLEIAKTASVSVRISLDWPCRYLEVKPEALINSVAALSSSEPMPCEYRPSTGEIVIGSVEAIHAAMQEQPNHSAIDLADRLLGRTVPGDAR